MHHDINGFGVNLIKNEVSFVYLDDVMGKTIMMPSYSISNLISTDSKSAILGAFIRKSLAV